MNKELALNEFESPFLNEYDGIALNENIYEIADIQRKYFDKMTFSGN